MYMKSLPALSIETHLIVLLVNLRNELLIEFTSPSNLMHLLPRFIRKLGQSVMSFIPCQTSISRQSVFVPHRYGATDHNLTKRHQYFYH